MKGLWTFLIQPNCSKFAEQAFFFYNYIYFERWQYWPDVDRSKGRTLCCQEHESRSWTFSAAHGRHCISSHGLTGSISPKFHKLGLPRNARSCWLTTSHTICQWSILYRHRVTLFLRKMVKIQNLGGDQCTSIIFHVGSIEYWNIDELIEYTLSVL